MSEDRCVCCGDVIPEGRQVCPKCERMVKMAKVGDTIRIIDMSGEPHYCGRVGVVTHIDSLGLLHGTWGGLAVIPGEDSYVVEEKE